MIRLGTAVIQQSTDGSHAGRSGKHAAHAISDAHRARIVLQGRRALLTLLLDRTTATADDVRDEIELPPGINPKCFGAVPGPLAKQQIIERIGFVESRRAKAHGRPVTVWRLVDREAALEWLQRYPAPEEECEPIAVSASAETPATPVADLPRETQRGLFDLTADSATAGGL